MFELLDPTPGRRQTAGAVAGSIADLARLGHPDKYLDTRAARVRHASLAEAPAPGVTCRDRAVAQPIVDPVRIEAASASGLGPVLEGEAGRPREVNDRAV